MKLSTDNWAWDLWIWFYRDLHPEIWIELYRYEHDDGGTDNCL